MSRSFVVLGVDLIGSACPATQAGHERSLTLKMFVLNGIVSFGALTLTSYVYRKYSVL